MIKLNLTPNNLNTTSLPFLLFNHSFFNFKNNRKEYFYLFTTHFQINLISKSKELFLDGTFYSCPKNFYQLLVIHCYDLTTDLYIPCFYVLMSHKSKELYQWLFENLKNYFEIINTKIA